MKINKIEFENFRNFKDRGEIRCSTDGRVTIVYGKNGDGKTTLHQLFQWILYGQVHFNKTTTDRLYNLQYEAACSFGQVFDVLGRIDFEHDNSQFSVTRTYTYKKGLNDSVKIAEDFSLLKMDNDKNWKPIENPKEVIDKLLPSGLVEYFFFDGESMIADLRVKGQDSASKLKKALFSMFDLDVYESAIAHIGRTDLKTTVLGKLFLSKGSITSDSEIAALMTNINNVQIKIEKTGEQLGKKKSEKADKLNLIRTISEKIGSTKSKADYEKNRKELIKQRDLFLKNAENAQSDFGEDVLDMFPQLLISKAVADAQSKISLSISKNKLPAGINKKLLAYLLTDTTKECICGQPLCAESKEHIRMYLDMLPPKSFTGLYNEFTATAKSWGKSYEKEKIIKHIKTVLDNTEFAEKCDFAIHELDDEQKKSPDIEDLVILRQEAENDIANLDNDISELELTSKKLDIILKKFMTEVNEQTKANENCKDIEAKIRIMEQVLDYFKKKLSDESIRFSGRLQENIQMLIDGMLTSKRKVSVSPEFAVKVTDSFGDESKSEGQFAVVSFAYIGGILRMLQSEASLSSKEYPLVLDGPFSKLDWDQRQNVINTIPNFAPQVILFSKDDLHEVLNAESIGRVWTIVSNDEKNVARVEEGNLWK